MDLADRVQWILEHRGVSARGLSLAAGLSQSHVGQIVRGQIKGQVSPDVLSSIARAGQVDLVWLLTGEGEPEGTPDTPPETRLERDEDEAVGTAEQALRAMRGAHSLDEATVEALRARLEVVQFSTGARLSSVVSFLEDELVALQAARRPRHEEEGDAGARPKPADDGVMRRTPNRGRGR